MQLGNRQSANVADMRNPTVAQQLSLNQLAISQPRQDQMLASVGQPMAANPFGGKTLVYDQDPPDQFSDQLGYGSIEQAAARDRLARIMMQGRR